jgi:RNA polymerase sigma factor (sigma-70 family)
MTGTAPEVGTAALLAQREWVRRIARALVVDVNAAEDLEQDLWVEVLQRPPRVRSSLRGWLASALRSRLLNAKRSASRRTRRELAASRPEAAAAADVVAEADAQRRVVGAVLEIAEPYRTALLLRFLEELPPSAIAQRLGVPAETVRTRVRRALDLLPERLDAQSGGDRAAWCAALLPLTARKSLDVVAAKGAAITGGVVMANKLVVAAAVAALVVSGGGVAWSVSQQSKNVARVQEAEAAALAARQESARLAAEVARLREEVGVTDTSGTVARVGGEAHAPAPQGSLRSAVDDHSTRLSALEQSLPAGTSSASLERGRQILAELQANRDGVRVAAIRESVQELVRIGDPVVPEIAAILDSGLDTRYRDDRPLMQHLHGYIGVRMVLNQALREIGTPAARTALFESARKSGRPSDFRDLIYDSESTTDSSIVEGISALVPDMLRSLAKHPIVGWDGDAIDLCWSVSAWIDKHSPPGVAEPLEDALRHAPSDSENGINGYDGLFRVLLELAPERAAGVMLDFLHANAKPGFLWSLSNGSRSASLTALARYYGVVLARQDLSRDQRAVVCRDMPDGPCPKFKDVVKRAEDAKPFVAFLEGAASRETDVDIRAQMNTKLAELKKSIGEAQKQQ